MERKLAIGSVLLSLFTFRASLAGDRPKVVTSHLELRSMTLGKNGGRELLDYLGKRLADGGTVDVVRPASRPDGATSPLKVERPEYLVSGLVYKVGDTCLATVQVIPVSAGLVTSATTDTTRCDQPSLEASLEKSAQALRNVFLRPPEPRPVVDVARPKVREVDLTFEDRKALAQHLAMALVEQGVARAVPAARARQILARRAKREGKPPPQPPKPDLELTVNIIKAGLTCQLIVSAKNHTDKKVPPRLSRRAECTPAALAGAVGKLAEKLATTLE